jgi:hypothetical protein
MKTKIFIPLVLLAGFIPASALAQQPAPGATTATGAVGGAAVGAVVGGPVGAVVGGIVGASMGAAAEPPAEVRTYVMAEPAPTGRVTAEVIEGQPLAANIEVRPVPKYPQYAYAVVNNKRVIVEPKTRQVLKIYE